VHHDEGLHFMYAWYFSEGRGYRHDPLMHGPFQFHIVAAFFRLFGDTETVARLPHAFFGTALVATPLLFRRYLNPTAVVLAAFFILISPSLLYYTRFAREDPFVMMWVVLLIASMLRYIDGGRLRWLLLYSAAMALNFATKETAYMYAAMLLLYLNAATAHALFWAPRRARGESASWRTQLIHGAWLVPSAWVIVAAWPLLGALRTRFGRVERPREADLLVLSMTLVLPLLAAGVEIPLKVAGVAIDLEMERTLGWYIVPALLAVSVAVGVAWRRMDWALCAVAFYLMLIPLYSSWGTNIDGIAGIFWTSLDYWIDQHGVQRAGQPWFYYVMEAPLYEGLVLFPGLFGGLWMVLRRRDPFAALLLWWAAAIFIALSVAGEKMPWLNMHYALPLCFLAAYVLGGGVVRALAAARAGRGSALAWAGTALAGTMVGVLLTLTLWTDYQVNIDHPETPIEPFMYAQATGDVPRLAALVHEGIESGEITGVVIDNQANLSWPWAWYVRDLPVSYVNRVDYAPNEYGRGTDQWPAMISEPGQLATPPGEWRREQYTHYRWPHEAGYKSMSWGRFRDELLDGTLLRQWSSFLIDRDPNSPMQYRDGEILLPAP